MLGAPRLNQRLYPALVADDWAVPEGFQESRWSLVPSGPVLARADLDAVRSSSASLRNLFRPNDDWPAEDLTLAAHRAALAWHAREFRGRRSFTYSIVTASHDRCLGSLHLYPSPSPVHNAEAYLWVRSDLPAMLARRLAYTIEIWVDHVWPFSHLAWPGRHIPWTCWRHFNAPNYQVRCRRP